MEYRLRVWWQRTTRQKVFLASNGFLARKERGLACRAHVDYGDSAPTGRLAIAAALPLHVANQPGYAGSSFARLQIWTVGDDIAWLNVGEDGLVGHQPEADFGGPGTSLKTNPNMLAPSRGISNIFHKHRT